MQTTIRSKLAFEGIGLHTGAPVRMQLLPAPSNYGVRFHRLDVAANSAEVPARWDLVETSPLCTYVRNADGVSVSTIEHVMAALAGCGVHNVRIEIDGPECPIMDGSSILFVRKILQTGVLKLDAPVKAIEVLKPVSVETENGHAKLSPGLGLTMDFHISFEDAAIGVQNKRLDLANGTFVRELCNSRTFCRARDVEAMHAAGKALGGSMENAVVIDGDKVLSPGGLRHKDEAVRHKMLDALGDLALAGLPIMGHYEGFKAGHAITNALLRSLMAQPDAYRIVECDANMAARLPGAGVGLHELPQVA